MAAPRRHVRYIGTTDTWSQIAYVVDKVGDFAHYPVGNLISVVGGLSALNLLTRVTPREIVLYDSSPSALEYARLLRALVAVADTRLELMRAIYGRAFESLDELTVENQVRSLAERPAADPEVIEPLINRLEPEMWSSYVECLIGDQETMQVLPSWTSGRRMTIDGERRRLWGVETQTLHLGRGWLADEQAYDRVRGCLLDVPLTLLDMNLSHIVRLLELLHEPGGERHDLVYISNIDEFMKAKYPPLVEQVVAAPRRNPLIWVSRNHVFRLGSGLRLDDEPVERTFGTPRFVGVSTASAAYLTIKRPGLEAVAPPKAPEPPKTRARLRHLPMSAFEDGTVDLQWQTDPLGNVNVQDYRMQRAAAWPNPARDPVTIWNIDRQLTLSNGFHRISELRARGYRGEVAAWVIDKPSGTVHWDKRYRRGAFGYLDKDGGTALFSDVARIITDAGARSVLDVGCWHGNLLRQLDDIDRYVGVDLSALAIEAAGQIERPFTVELYTGDLRDHPAPAAPIEAIYFGACLGYVDDPVQTIVDYTDRYAARLVIWQEAAGFVDIGAHVPGLWKSGRFDLLDYSERKYPMRKFGRRRRIVLAVRDR